MDDLLRSIEEKLKEIHHIDYGNSKLLFITLIFLYDMDNGGDDYGNKKYYFETADTKRIVTG